MPSITHCCYVRCTILIVRVWEMHWPKTGVTYYHITKFFILRECSWQHSYTYCCYVRCTILIVRVLEMYLPQNRRNSLPCIVKIFRKRFCNQRVGCLKRKGYRAFDPAKRSILGCYQPYLD